MQCSHGNLVPELVIKDLTPPIATDTMDANAVETDATNDAMDIEVDDAT